MGVNPPLPAIFYSLSEWVAILSVRRLKTKSIKAYLTDVRSAYMDISFEDLNVFHSPRLKRVLNDTRRLRDEAETQKRRPITRDILLQILSHFDFFIKHNATIRAAFYLAFATFLRMGEFTYESKDLHNEDFHN